MSLADVLQPYGKDAPFSMNRSAFHFCMMLGQSFTVSESLSLKSLSELDAHAHSGRLNYRNNMANALGRPQLLRKLIRLEAGRARS